MTRTFKRPAQASPAPAEEPPVKKQAVEDAPPDKCALILKVLSTVEGVPASVLAMLQGMAPHALGKATAERHAFQAAVAEMVGEVLESVELQAEADVKEMQSKVDGCEEDRLARQATLEAAEKRIEAAKAAAIKEDAEVKATKEAAGQAQKHLLVAQRLQNAGDEKLKVAEEKAKRLQDAQTDILLPAKSKVADDAEVNVLASLGKDFSFDPSFMEAMPLVLKKKPEARVGFDLVTLEQLEQEMSRVIAEQMAIIEEGAPAKAQRKQASATAQATFDTAHDKHAAAKEALNKALLEEQEGEAALKDAKEAVANFFPEAKVLMDCYDSKKAWLTELRAGALAAFKELTQTE